MDSKLSILLFLTTLAGSSFALENGSCVAETTIEASLAKIQLAEDKTLKGLAKAANLINGELVDILVDKSKGISTHSEDAQSRAARAQQECFAAFMLGIPPTAEAYTILQPKLNVSSVEDVLRTSLQRINDAIWKAIRIIRNAKDYSKSRTKVEKMFESGRGAVAGLMEESFDLMLNGTALIPEGAEDVVACVKAQASSELLGAVGGAAKEMYMFLEALFEVKSQSDLPKYPRQIAPAHKEVHDCFRREVIHKFSIIRNLVIADYLNKNGIVTGLFALQAATGKKSI